MTSAAASSAAKSASAADASSTTGRRRGAHVDPAFGADPLECFDAVCRDAAGLAARSRGRDRQQTRIGATATGVTRGSLDQRGQELLVAGQELAAPVERDRPAHPGSAGSSGGVTFLICRWRLVDAGRGSA